MGRRAWLMMIAFVVGMARLATADDALPPEMPQIKIAHLYGDVHTRKLTGISVDLFNPQPNVHYVYAGFPSISRARPRRIAGSALPTSRLRTLSRYGRSIAMAARPHTRKRSATSSSTTGARRCRTAADSVR